MTIDKKPEVSKGGRGNKAPYRITHVRVPVPIKEDIERQINDFRRAVSNGEVIVSGDAIYHQAKIDSQPDWESVLLAVNLFIEEKKLGDSMGTRNNVNLSRFKDWVKDKAIAQFP